MSSRILIPALGKAHDSLPMLQNINFRGVLTREEPGIEDGVRMWHHKLYTASEDPAAIGKSWPGDIKGQILQEHQTGKHSNFLTRKLRPR